MAQLPRHFLNQIFIRRPLGLAAARSLYTLSAKQNAGASTTSQRKLQQTYFQGCSAQSMYRNMSDSSKGDPRQAEETDSSPPSSQALTQRQKLSKVFAQYGSAAVVFHTAISLTSLGTCYVIVSSGIDMVAILESLNIVSKEGMQSTIAGGASTFVVAYAVHKVFMPVRVFLTVTCTPLLVRKLRAMGILKGTTTPSQ